MRCPKQDRRPGFKHLLLLLLTLSSFILYAKNHEYVVLSKKTDVSLKSQTLTTRTELLIQINSREGEHAAEFAFYYSPGLKLKKLNAWLQDTAGTVIRKLEKKQIAAGSELYGSFYSDYMVKSFELKHNRYPYQVRVEYDYETDEFLRIADWSPVYDPAAPTLLATLTLEIPLNYPVNILRKRTEAPVTDTLDGTVKYTWTGSYLHLIKHETCRPPDDDLRPFVCIVPRAFEYGIKGSFSSWTTFGDYIDALMQDGETLPASEITTVKTLTSGMEDTLLILKKLFRYLQDNTRYINISVDVGGMKPYPASYVAQNKYGDCKALTLFMKSLLEAAGIRSCYTLVYGDDLPAEIDTGFPAQQFNHAILCVPIRTDTLWLDCTSKEFPAGYTPAFIQGRPALVILKGNSKIVNIPAMTSREVAENSTYLCTLSSPGNMEATVRGVYKGPVYEKITYAAMSADVPKKEEFARNLVPYRNCELLKHTFTKGPEDESSIRFDAHFKVKNTVQSFEDRLIFTPPPASLPTFEKVTAREFPVQFPYPSLKCDSIILEIPEGMTVKSFPGTELSCEAGHYQVTCRREHNRLLYVRTLEMKRGKFGLEQYPAFMAWVGAINAFERQHKIILSPVHE